MALFFDAAQLDGRFADSNNLALRPSRIKGHPPMAQTVQSAEIAPMTAALFLSLDARAAMVEIANASRRERETAELRGR